VARSPWHGEVWTDGRGFACVMLPAAVDGELRVELRPLTAGVTATLRGEPTRRRFTIETDEPHVKVAWRVDRRRPQNTTQARESHKEETCAASPPP
jgi:hypothetical protein